ncbi:hypothetical protein OXX79_005485 [Metschnikowia pulcherrima]
MSVFLILHIKDGRSRSPNAAHHNYFRMMFFLFLLFSTIAVASPIQHDANVGPSQIPVTSGPNKDMDREIYLNEAYLDSKIKRDFDDEYVLDAANTFVARFLHHTEASDAVLSKVESPPTTNLGRSISSGTNQKVEETFFAQDLKKVFELKARLDWIFPRLLSYVSETGHDDRNCALLSEEFNTEKFTLTSAFAWMAYNGNLFMTEIARPYYVVKHLFQLLQFRDSLMERFNQDTASTQANKIEQFFHLRLVEFELSLFRFFRSDTMLDVDADDFAQKVESAEMRLGDLAAQLPKNLPPQSPLHKVYVSEIGRFRGLILSLRRVVAARASSTHDVISNDSVDMVAA